MKNFNWALFLGCCVIGICIAAAGRAIAGKLPDTTVVPGSFSIITRDAANTFGEYLSLYEAGAYINVTTDNFMALVRNGELDGTFTLIGDDYLFSREKLSLWLAERIGNG